MQQNGAQNRATPTFLCLHFNPSCKCFRESPDLHGDAAGFEQKCSRRRRERNPRERGWGEEMNEEVERGMRILGKWTGTIHGPTRSTGMAASADEAGRASGPEYGWPQWSLYHNIFPPSHKKYNPAFEKKNHKECNPRYWILNNCLIKWSDLI